VEGEDQHCNQAEARGKIGEHESLVVFEDLADDRVKPKEEKSTARIGQGQFNVARIAGSNQSWRLVMEDASQSVDQSDPGIFDVRSGSSKVGLDGRAYSEW